jgi:hypothetical protein
MALDDYRSPMATHVALSAQNLVGFNRSLLKA